MIRAGSERLLDGLTTRERTDVDIACKEEELSYLQFHTRLDTHLFFFFAWCDLDR